MEIPPPFEIPVPFITQVASFIFLTMGVFGKGVGILLWSRKFKNEGKGPQYLSKLVLNKLVFNPLNGSCLASSAVDRLSLN